MSRGAPSARRQLAAIEPAAVRADDGLGFDPLRVDHPDSGQPSSRRLPTSGGLVRILSRLKREVPGVGCGVARARWVGLEAAFPVQDGDACPS